MLSALTKRRSIGAFARSGAFDQSGCLIEKKKKTETELKRDSWPKV